MMLAAALVVSATLVGQASGLPDGAGKVVVEVGGRPLDVYTYKPKDYRGGPLIMVFHGVLRNASEYRDHAQGMADRFGAVVAAPEFDSKRFPSIKYNRGGLLRPDRTAAPRSEWTWTMVPKIADALRKQLGRPDLPYYLIGHSAGGQFVGRMAAFVDTGAERVVAANPSAYVFPTRDFDFSYGFGALPDELSDEDALRRYLAQPLTIYLGTADNQRDEDLDKSREADREGKNRLERGRNMFAAGQKLAREKGWPFRWRLVEAEGVNHDHQAMFDAPACAEALFGPVGKPPASPSEAK